MSDQEPLENQESEVSRRRFLSTAGAASASLLAGCAAYQSVVQRIHPAPPPKVAPTAVQPAVPAVVAPAPPPPPPLAVTLPPAPTAATLQVRRARVATALREAGMSAVVMEPSANLDWLTDARLERSDRPLLALMFAQGDPIVLAPSFDRARIQVATGFQDVRGWHEQEDPFVALGSIMAQKLDSTSLLGVEGTTRYWVVQRMNDALRIRGVANADERVFQSLREIKAVEEIDNIRAASKIARQSVESVQSEMHVGMTDHAVEGALSLALSQYQIPFTAKVRVGTVTAFPLAGAGGEIVVEGSPVTLEVTCSVNGYLGSCTRSWRVGGAPIEQYTTIEAVVRNAQHAAAEMLRPGVAAEDIDSAARKVVSAAGFGDRFPHRVGAGIGMSPVESPVLAGGSTRLLEAGMTVSVGPGIYEPNWFGICQQDVWLVTPTGAELLS